MLRHRAHFALEECRSARRSRYCGQGDQVSVQPFVAAQIDNHSEDRFAPGQLQSLAGQEHGQTIHWVNQVISGAGLDFRFSPVSDQTAALH